MPFFARLPTSSREEHRRWPIASQGMFFAMSIIPETADQRRKRMLDEQQRGGTFFEHGVTAADDEVGGRFGAQGKPTVIGNAPLPTYPASALSGQPDAGPELPLGYRIDAMPELGQDPTGLSMLQPVDTGGPPDAPSSTPIPSTFERGGPPSSSNGDGPTGVLTASPSGTQLREVGSPPPSNKRSE